MNIDALKAQLFQHVGFRPCAYQDSLGIWTIGVGRNIDHRGGGISKEEALVLLDHDIARVTEELDRALPWWQHMTDARQQVLANLCFNIGLGTLLTFHNTLAAMQNGNYEAAAAEMLRSKWAKQVGKRAEELADMMRKG